MENQQTGEIFKFEGNEARDFALISDEIREVDGETLIVKRLPAGNFNTGSKRLLRKIVCGEKCTKLAERHSDERNSGMFISSIRICLSICYNNWYGLCSV